VQSIAGWNAWGDDVVKESGRVAVTIVTGVQGAVPFLSTLSCLFFSFTSALVLLRNPDGERRETSRSLVGW
jgi:hypothetical protein